MKRILLAVLLPVLGLFGCTAPTAPVPPVTSGFSCTFSAVYEDLTAAGTLSRSDDGVLTVAFSAPDTLKGTAVCWRGEKVTLQIGGFSAELPLSQVPQGALGTLINAILGDAAAAVGTRQSDDLLFTGTANGSGYTLLCDGRSGNPRSLEIPDIPLSVVFDGVTKA